ncbi:hypothetical protein FE257_012804 [Aspergillus nanangensis]|uniref:Uncharacterized protein n=1 Tax=Aspergillus nanangensis TaxID=2582783 RepID=A0AAD4GRP7_ASPNN|nr:hypothetical protein FE257_012804 [Aspergillus nanangensis]
MALLSPGRLAALHQMGATETRVLQDKPSDSYERGYAEDVDHIIPSPTLFDSLRDQHLVPDDMPAISQCATHLELLEVFHSLRNRVIQSRYLDNAFNIHPSKRIVYHRKHRRQKKVGKELRDTGFEGRREEKWKYYLNIATARFEQWIQGIDTAMNDLEIPPCGRKVLPPLDVLVVWHAFLLNPADFKEYCLKKRLQHVQKIIFPWREIHEAIDSTTWRFTVPADQAGWILQTTLLEPDLLHTLTEDSHINYLARDLLRNLSESRWYNLAANLRQANDRQSAFMQTIHAAINNQIEHRPLVENVQRQCIFVDKMHAHRWIRSPAVQGTLTRAVDKYENFLELFRLYPNKFLVPTLDVDLVWHTHQCSAELYRGFVVDRVGRFINHEDNISRGTLDTGFTSTEEWYQLRFGEQYQVCLCWYCEAILSAVEEEEVKDGGSWEAVDVEEIVERVGEEVEFCRDLEISRQKGRRLPRWKHGAGV